MNRREMIAAVGAALAGLGLKDLVAPESAFAQARPKSGGKFVYTNLYPNNRMGTRRTAATPTTCSTSTRAAPSTAWPT